MLVRLDILEAAGAGRTARWDARWVVEVVATAGAAVAGQTRKAAAAAEVVVADAGDVVDDEVA